MRSSTRSNDVALVGESIARHTTDLSESFDIATRSCARACDASTRDRSASIANEGDDRERGEGPSLDGAPTAVGWTRTDANATRRRERHRDDQGTIKDEKGGKRKERTNEA